MPSTYKEIDRAFRFSPFPWEGRFRNMAGLVDSYRKQDAIYREIKRRIDEKTLRLVDELCFAIEQEQELCEQHYYTEGWLAAQKHAARKKRLR